MDILRLAARNEDGLDDPSFEFCLRVMDRVYEFSPCLPNFTTKSYYPPSLPAHSHHDGRNLWIDAFGVINFIALYRYSKMAFYLVCAEALVDDVHNSLGRTNDFKSRLPGATDEDPTKGGLRAGKMSEYDNFGDPAECQDFLSLAMWMFALNRLSMTTRQPHHNEHALQLAAAVYPPFSANCDLVGRMPQKLTEDLQPIPRATSRTRSYIVTSLAATVIRGVQTTAARFGRRHIPLLPEIRQCWRVLGWVYGQRPDLLRCPDIDTALRDTIVFLSSPKLCTIGLYLFIGCHATGCDGEPAPNLAPEPWAAAVADSARAAARRFLALRQQSVHDDCYAPVSELLVAAAAKCHPELRHGRSGEDKPPWADVDGVLSFWNRCVRAQSAAPPRQISDPAELYMLYVAAQMPRSLKLRINSADDEVMDAPAPDGELATNGGQDDASSSTSTSTGTDTSASTGTGTLAEQDSTE